MFSVIDSQDCRIGGVEAITVVQLTDDSSRLSNSSSPTTSSSATTDTALLSPEVIAAIAIGRTMVLVMTAILVILLFRKRGRTFWDGRPNEPIDLTFDPTQNLSTGSLGLTASYAAMPFIHSPSV